MRNAYLCPRFQKRKALAIRFSSDGRGLKRIVRGEITASQWEDGPG